MNRRPPMQTVVRRRHLLLHPHPNRVADRLQKLAAMGIVDDPPNMWQLWLGATLVRHRALFRSETVGLSTEHPVRDTWRARLFQFRPLRSPFLLFGRRIHPHDTTGLATRRDHLIKHIIGAHHESDDFAYDLQILTTEPGALEELRDEARAVVSGDHPKAAFLRDLCVYEGYHEQVLATVEDWLERGGLEDPDRDHLNADKTLAGWLTWCSRQPPTLRDTLRAMRRGELSFDPSLS